MSTFSHIVTYLKSQSTALNEIWQKEKQLSKELLIRFFDSVVDITIKLKDKTLAVDIFGVYLQGHEFGFDSNLNSRMFGATIIAVMLCLLI